MTLSITNSKSVIITINKRFRGALTASALTISLDPLCWCKFSDGLHLKEDWETGAKRLAYEDAKPFSLFKVLQLEEEYIRSYQRKI